MNWREGVPTLSFSARDLANREVREALGSGLRKRIVLTVQAFASGRRTPLATRRFACAVTYDLWEGAYVVRMGRRTELFAELQPVIDRCLVVRGFTIGTAEDYREARGRPVYFAVRAEFNPISARRCRELLRSNRAEDPVGPLVINIVRREICQAERATEFQSPPAGVPERAR